MNWMQIAETARALVEGQIDVARPLAPLTTYRLGGPAALLLEPASSQDLVALVAVLNAHESGHEVPWLALGRGSNVVISDDGWDGVVVRLGGAWSWIEPHGDDGVDTGAATSLPQLANWAARRSLSGLEFAVGVPGSVGGAVRMNAGAHEGDVAATLVDAEIFDVAAGAPTTRTLSELDLAYRHSALRDGEIVLQARLKLVPDHAGVIRERMDRYRRHRAVTQPGALQNAGSVFKNPPGRSAGSLVEAAGVKGFAIGGASVSNLHANFFMASADASAQDVFDLVREVRARVLHATGIELEPEIRFVGRFRNDPRATAGTAGSEWQTP